MNKQKKANLLGMSADERLAYSVRRIADFEEIWGLFLDGWGMMTDDTGRNQIAFWPESDLAELCANGVWIGHEPKRIGLEEFLSKWLPGMESDGLFVAMFPTPENNAVVLGPINFRDLLTDELNRYE